MFIKYIYFVLFGLFIIVKSKPLNNPIDYSNEIDDGQQKNEKIIQSEMISNFNHRNLPESISNITLWNNAENQSDNGMMAASNSTTNVLVTLLDLLAHKFNLNKFSPQAFIQDRLGLFKEILPAFGITTPKSVTLPNAKQILNPNGLIHLAGLDDNGFYTNRLQPAGFLGGNGWFANKGGLLGGPGAILSTGSLLTDYPTSYKKK